MNQIKKIVEGIGSNIEKIYAEAERAVQNYKREYLIETSGKNQISCTEDELHKISKAAETGSFAWLKNGMVNPSHIVSITLDRKKMRDYQEKVKKWTENALWENEYISGDLTIRPIEKQNIEKSIFEGTKLVSDEMLLDKSKLLK